MARDKRSKPSNVVRSRSASLLGGLGSGRQKEELPSNRFIELGDIALGNSKRREVEIYRSRSGAPMEELLEVEVLPERKRPSAGPNANAPNVEAPRNTGTGVAARLTRGNPPRPKTSLPPKAHKAPLPPKVSRPKPPNIRRPKPITNRPR